MPSHSNAILSQHPLPVRVSFTGVALIACLGLLQACGGGGGGASAPITPPTVVTPPPPDPDPDPMEPPPPVTSALLVSPATDGSFAAAVTRRLNPSSLGDTGGLVTSPALGEPSIVGSPAPGEQSDSFSTSYRLEAEVGELDIVGYDGEHLVIAPSRSSDCCLTLSPAMDLPPPPPSESPVIRILRTDPEAAIAIDVGEIPLTENQSAEGLFFDGDELSVISSSAWWGSHGGNFGAATPWEDQSTFVSVYNISNTAAPIMEWRLAIEGALVAGRKIGDQILVITRHYPSIEGVVAGSNDPEVVANNEAISAALSDEDVLPGLLINGEPTDALTASDCLLLDPGHPQAPQETGFPVVTTLFWLNVESRELTDVQCMAETVEGVYVSPSSVFLAQSVVDTPNVVETLVHRFDLSAQIEYRGSGRVDGGLNTRGQADFRMSDDGDVLRMVTTQFTSNGDDRFDHRLFTLALSDSVPALEILAVLPESTDAPQLGKANEDIFGVRFFGDRAYLVTFEVIDPLIVIDLADPSAPQVLGELEIPGFSDLLIPVTRDLLLGLGEDGERQLKLELYDIETPSAPTSRGIQLLGDDASSAFSEARFDRRALTYLPGEAFDRFAVPVSVILEVDNIAEAKERLYMMQIDNKLDPGEAQLNIAGVMEVGARDFVTSQPRAIIDQDAVFFILADEVWSSFWGSSDVPMGPY